MWCNYMGYLDGMANYATHMVLALTALQATAIFNDVTSIVTYLTVSCVTWWFGDRRMAKSIMQLKGVDQNKIR
jgi:hypothetical protein